MVSNIPHGKCWKCGEVYYHTLRNCHLCKGRIVRDLGTLIWQ